MNRQEKHVLSKPAWRKYEFQSFFSKFLDSQKNNPEKKALFVTKITIARQCFHDY